MAVAIICEFNPLHNGHLHLINAVKKLCNDDIICVMSGGFTQRGDITILNKFTRAKHALLAGADMVVELPVLYATSAASYFAFGAIKTISLLPNITKIAFSCECGDLDILKKTLDVTTSKEYNLLIAKYIKSGKSYTVSSSLAFKEITNFENPLLTPNNLLAVEYLRNVALINKPYDFYAFKRIGANFNDANLQENFSSSSAIRQNINDNKMAGIKNNVPECVFDNLSNSKVYYDRLFALICNNATFMQNVYEDTEGVLNRIKKFIPTSQNYEDLVNSVHAKRYTKSKIRRILLHIALNLTNDLINEPFTYTTVLGVKKEKRNLLSFTATDAANKLFLADLHSNNIYNILSDDKITTTKLRLID